MPESWKDFFSSEIFMPHGHCYLWKPALVWLQVISNGSIALAYLSIFATLVYLVYRIKNIPFSGVYIAFAVFIISCGFTHLFDIYVIWNPAYWLDGSVRAITAIASVLTAIFLPPLVPKAVALAEAARLSQERGSKLEQANRDLAILLEKTRQLEQLKTQFFTNISHELRTPLTLILGPTERLLGTSNVTPDQRRDLDLIGRNTRTLMKHVNDLLDVSKLEAGKMELLYVKTDVARLLRRVASQFDGLAQERCITYRFDCIDTVMAEVDIDQLERVFLNLLSNAFNFTPSGGQIRCSVYAYSDGEIRLEVADNGPGVRLEERNAIFERFHQTESDGSRRRGGTGLGLAIARDFVTQHGGSLTVNDAPEGGALFTMSLPRVAPRGVTVVDEVALRTTSKEEPARQALEALRSYVEPWVNVQDAEKPLVLVVEDNPELNHFVCQSLADDYRVESSFDGHQGVAKAKELKPDLILTGVMMPELNGEQLVKQLRADPTLDLVPIVLLTAKADNEFRVKLLREGAQDYLMKPFSIDELKTRIGNLVTVKRAREVLQHELESQGKDLNALTHEVTRRKRELETALSSVRVAREHAEHASQLKTNFLSLFSHELRTPLTAVQLQLERLKRVRDATLSPQQQDILQRLAGSSGRLAELVESILHYSRMESGRLTTEIQTFDVCQVIREILDDFQSRAEVKQLTLNLHAMVNTLELRSDPHLLRLMLTNLVSNAIKFTKQGSVNVRLSHHPFQGVSFPVFSIKIRAVETCGVWA